MIEPGSRWTGYLLLASLALNVFVIGLIVTRTMIATRETMPIEVKNTLNVAVQPTEPLMPQQFRKFLVEAMDPHRKPIQAAFKRQNDARIALTRALATEPFDPKAVDAALVEMRAAQTETHQLVSGPLLEAAPNLPPDERLRMTQMFQNPWLGWRQSLPNPDPPKTFQLQTDR